MHSTEAMQSDCSTANIENLESSAVKPADLSQDDSQVDLCAVLGGFTLTKRHC